MTVSELESDGSEMDDITVLQGGRGDAYSVDERSVGGGKVSQQELFAVIVEFGVVG